MIETQEKRDLGKLVDRARRAVIASYTITWMSTGGVPYRKTKTWRGEDHIRAKLLCEILVDDLGYEDYRTGTDLFTTFLQEAVASGELVEPAPGKTWVHRNDVQWLTRDDVPVRGK